MSTSSPSSSELSSDPGDLKPSSSTNSLSSADPTSDTVLVTVSVPVLRKQEDISFHLDQTVWQAKQQVLASLAKGIPDGQNYGLFSSPSRGQAGKFLAEERVLRDYPIPLV